MNFLFFKREGLTLPTFCNSCAGKQCVRECCLSANWWSVSFHDLLATLALELHCKTEEVNFECCGSLWNLVEHYVN